VEERRIVELLARLGRRVAPPAEDELRTMARAAAESPRVPPEAARRRPWRPFHVRWALAVAAALLLGSGFGFGLGTRQDGAGSAATSFVGFGFLSSQGWTVVQSGTPDPTGAARAIAANVPLHPDDEVGAAPFATLESLPPHGVLILATFTSRGDLAEDVTFPDRRLPLKISGAKQAPSSEALPFARRLAEYRLRAGVGATTLTPGFISAPSRLRWRCSARRNVS